MLPNLGGFFRDRSYYPSECKADYFDFERIEALKPAIEACGISTLSQSPMLGFHKQMDNRIKLLEEILSFRMQGVFFFQAEDGIRDWSVTGVQTCALPISSWQKPRGRRRRWCACCRPSTAARTSTAPSTRFLPRRRRRSTPSSRPTCAASSRRRSEERRVGKECRSRWSPYH